MSNRFLSLLAMRTRKKPKQLLFPLNIFLFSTLLFISGNVSAAKISCRLPSGEVFGTYKSTCNSKEGVEVAKVASVEDLEKLESTNNSGC